MAKVAVYVQIIKSAIDLKSEVNDYIGYVIDAIRDNGIEAVPKWYDVSDSWYKIISHNTPMDYANAEAFMDYEVMSFDEWLDGGSGRLTGR